MAREPNRAVPGRIGRIRTCMSASLHGEPVRLFWPSLARDMQVKALLRWAVTFGPGSRITESGGEDGKPVCSRRAQHDGPREGQAFYGKLFDWKYEEIPGADGIDYTSIGVGETGVWHGRRDAPPENARRSIGMDAIRSRGRHPGGHEEGRVPRATILKDVTEVPGMGSLSILTDPTGAVIGLWQTKM